VVVHRNESVLKNIFKRGYEEIRDRKLLKIWKKNQTWLKYEYMSKRRPHFFSKTAKRSFNFCDSNVNKCLPANHF
jgi:hypothetical protein